MYMYMCVLYLTNTIVPYVMLREEDGESGNVICRILEYNLVDCIL